MTESNRNRCGRRRNRNMEIDVCMYAGILMLGIVVIAALCGWWVPVE
jgi:hypothetical protein